MRNVIDYKDVIVGFRRGFHHGIHRDVKPDIGCFLGFTNELGC